MAISRSADRPDALPEGLVNLRALGPELRGLAGEIVERVVELGLVEVGLPGILARHGPDVAVGGARERVLLLGGLLGQLVAGVRARSLTAASISVSAASTSASPSAS